MPGPSTRNLSALPNPGVLKQLTRSIATLDAIICPEWEYRYYSFNSNWGAGEEVASMNDGQGDEWFIAFSADGVFIKGFDHESPMSPWANDDHKVWGGILESVPEQLIGFTNEPAFSVQNATFCIWRLSHENTWQRGEISFPDGIDPDGSSWMMQILDGNPQTYKKWAEEYYERSLPLNVIEAVYRHEPLTPSMLASLNSNVTLSDIAADLEEIGFPNTPI